MEKTYLSITAVNGYTICTMTKDLCESHGLDYPCFYALTEQHALTLSPNAAVHYSNTYDDMYVWCLIRPNAKCADSTCFIIASYQRGRNLANDMLWFASRDEAKAYAASHLDTDELVSRYTIYDL